MSRTLLIHSSRKNIMTKNSMDKKRGYNTFLNFINFIFIHGEGFQTNGVVFPTHYRHLITHKMDFNPFVRDFDKIHAIKKKVL